MDKTCSPDRDSTMAKPKPRFRIVPVRFCDGESFEIWITSDAAEIDRPEPPQAA
jgi:hypothetical protein